METSPKKSARAKLPISDDMLVDITTKATLEADSLPHATEACEEKTDADKTCSEWKETYLVAHESRENRLRSAGESGGHNFGTSNTATNPTNDHQVTFQDHHTIPYDALERLKSYLTNMSDAVANAATAGSLDAAEIF